MIFFQEIGGIEIGIDESFNTINYKEFFVSLNMESKTVL